MYIKNFLAFLFGFFFIGLAYHLIDNSKLTGAEFVALVGLGLFTALIVKLGDRIESLTFGGSAIKLMRENERAESNIERLDELSSAIADSLIISLPGVYDDHCEQAYFSGLDFVNRYRLFRRLQPNKRFPEEKIELAVRNYLYGTNIGIKYRAMYDETPDIPSPSQLLSNFTSDKQRSSVKEHKYFEFYDSDIYPIYIETMARELNNK